MRVRIIMKCPDAVSMAIEEALESVIEDPAYQGEDIEEVQEELRAEAEEAAEKFFRYGEIVQLELDTVGHTCTVIRVK